MNRSIYVTNFQDHNIDAAKRFLSGSGVMINITEGRVNIFATDGLERQIRYVLKGMTKDDILLIVGNSYIASITMAIVMDMFDEVNFLIWDYRQGDNGDYCLRNLKGKGKDDE